MSLSGGFPNEKRVPSEYKEAVDLACQMIRVYHQQTACINEAASKFGLDPKEVEKYVKERQSLGKQKKVEGKKYKFYIICRISEDSETHRKICYERPKIVKSLSKEALIEKYKAEDDYKTGRNSFSDKYSSIYYTDFLGNIEGYESKKKCETAFEQFKDYLKDKDYIYNY